ncbi:MAG: DinB family protein [Dehalococcoidia bacterium]
MPKLATPALQTFIDGWENYQQLLLTALRPLTDEQMALKPAPHQWAVWQIASHMAGARMYWFHDFLKECDPALRDHFRVAQTTVPGLSLIDAGWEDDERRPRTAAEVVDAFERTWAAISGCFARWTPAELKVTYRRKLRTGGEQVRSREWVIWHLIEHELHHGGEISNILGSNGLAAPDL